MLPKYIRVNGEVYQRVAYSPRDAESLFQGVLKGLGSLRKSLQKPSENMIAHLDEYIGDLEKVRNMLGNEFFKKSLGSTNRPPRRRRKR